jgi:hypothetical protein
MEMVMLDFHRMNRAALWARFSFSVRKPHFSYVFTAASYFDTYDCTIVQNVYPVIVEVTLVLEVQNDITPVDLFFNPTIALVPCGDNPRYEAWEQKKRDLK